jgi:hypothetical protein
MKLTTWQRGIKLTLSLYPPAEPARHDAPAALAPHDDTPV